MADVVSPEKRSEMMAGIRGKNTQPEIRIRSLLHKKGYRFVLGGKKLPGKPDLVLPKYHVAIFVHGCFWHGHEKCHLFRIPKSREEFWSAKIGGNIARDTKNLALLTGEEWRVCTIWECAIKGRGKLAEEKLITRIDKWIKSTALRKTLRGKAVKSGSGRSSAK